MSGTLISIVCHCVSPDPFQPRGIGERLLQCSQRRIEFSPALLAFSVAVVAGLDQQRRPARRICSSGPHSVQPAPLTAHGHRPRPTARRLRETWRRESSGTACRKCVAARLSSRRCASAAGNRRRGLLAGVCSTCSSSVPPLQRWTRSSAWLNAGVHRRRLRRRQQRHAGFDLRAGGATRSASAPATTCRSNSRSTAAP